MHESKLEKGDSDPLSSGPGGPTFLRAPAADLGKYDMFPAKPNTTPSHSPNYKQRQASQAPENGQIQKRQSRVPNKKPLHLIKVPTLCPLDSRDPFKDGVVRSESSVSNVTRSVFRGQSALFK